MQLWISTADPEYIKIIKMEYRTKFSCIQQMRELQKVEKKKNSKRKWRTLVRASHFDIAD